MSSVKDIERAIGQLSHTDLSELRAWFTKFDGDAWDRQIEDDAESGRLDAFYRSLEHENEGQTDLPLNEVIDKGELS